jgi:hypothetical protein
MRRDLRLALIMLFDSQVRASRRLKIPESKLSYIINGHSDPNPREREILERALGRDYFATEEGPRAA